MVCTMLTPSIVFIMFEEAKTLRHNQLVKQIQLGLFNQLITSYSNKDFYKGREDSIHLVMAEHGEELNVQMQYIDDLKKLGFIIKYKSLDFKRELLPPYKPTKLENEFDAGEGLGEMNSNIDDYNSRISGETFNGLLVQIDSDKLDQYLKELKSKKVSKGSNLVITKDTDGNYYYEGRRINFAGSGVYLHVLNVLLDHASPDKCMTYEEINKYLESDYGHPVERNKEKIHIRVKNAVSNQTGLFYYATVNGKRLENVLSNGKELIHKVRGKGLIFNNKK